MTACRGALRVLAVIAYVLIVVLLVVWFLVARFVMAVSTDTTYFGVDDTAVVAGRLVGVAIIAGCGVLFAVVVGAVAARRRRGGWLFLGIMTAAMCGYIILEAAMSWLSFTAELRGGSQSQPAPPATDMPPTRDAAYTEMQRMITASLAAVEDQRSAAGGGPLITDDVRISAELCNGEGNLLSADFTFVTGGPTAAEDILAVWDAAGYQPRSASQTDIRYSSTLPIAKNGAR